nr:hypothetical protein [Tanacetum cinerariifolium]
KGKKVVSEAVSLNPIDPELLKIDVAPLALKLRNVCPLTRIATTTIVPPSDPIPIVNNTDKPVVTLVYSRKTKAATKKVPVCNFTISKSLVANKLEPNNSWGSSSSNVPFPLINCRLSKLSSEVVATACFTQNRSIVRLRHGKTPYELLHTMASEQSSLGPALNEMTPGGLMQKYSSLTSYVPPSRNDWDLLFQPMFDELLNPPPSVVNQAPEVIAPIAEVIPPVHADSTGSPSSTTVDQDATSPSKSHTTTEIQSSVIPQDVGDDNLDMEVAHMGNDPLFGAPIPEVTST